MNMLNKLGGVAALAATVLFAPQPASADRVCRQECMGPVCTEKCVEETSDRGENFGIRDDERSQNRMENRDDDRRDRDNTIELRVPGVGGVEIGR
jgi:hypothetical protein